jgi:hypothetical protein
MGLVLLMTACTVSVQSLQPLYTEEDLIFEPKLLGAWVTGGGSDELLAFVKSGENEYKVMTNIYPFSLKGRLMKLGGCLFLDLTPADTDDVFSIPGHLFVKIQVNGDTLNLALLDSDWAKRVADAGNLGLSHTLVGGRVVLTAPVEDLQAFVALHAGDGSIFKDYMEYRRAESVR